MSVLNAQTERRGIIRVVADMPVMADAACYGYPTHWWFADEAEGPDGNVGWRESGHTKRQRHAVRDAAIEICHGCPLIEQCRDWTEQHPELTAFGIWAGRTARERRAGRGAQRRRKAVAS